MTPKRGRRSSRNFVWMWQRAVAAQLLACDVGDDLFTRGLDDEVALVPILHAQQLRAHLVEAARLLPQLGRLHHRHQQLHRARAVHLFANDRLHFADHAQAHRHIAVDARAEPLDKAGAHHQLVTHDLCIGGRFLERGNEELGGFHAGRARSSSLGDSEGNPRGCVPSCRCNNRFNENFGVDYARP